MMHGSEEMTVVVEKAKLLEILNKNLETHVSEYKEAMSGYMDAGTEALAERLEAFKNGEDADLDFSSFPKPQSYAEDYERAIGMLQLHSEPTMRLSMHAYRQFVDDEWSWKRGFGVLNSTYQR